MVMATGGSSSSILAVGRPSKYWKRIWCQCGHTQNLWYGVSASMPQKGHNEPPSAHLQARLWVTREPVITARSDALVLSAAVEPRNHLHDVELSMPWVSGANSGLRRPASSS